MHDTLVISGNKTIENFVKRIDDFENIGFDISKLILDNNPTASSIEVAEIYKRETSEMLRLYTLLSSEGALDGSRYECIMDKVRQTEFSLSRYLFCAEGRTSDADGQHLVGDRSSKKPGYRSNVYSWHSSLKSLEKVVQDMETVGFEVAKLILCRGSTPASIEVAEIYRIEAELIRRTYSTLSETGGSDLLKYREVVSEAEYIELLLSYRILDALYDDFSRNYGSLISVHDEVQSIQEWKFAQEHKDKLDRMSSLYALLLDRGHTDVLQRYEVDKMLEVKKHLGKVIMLNRPINRGSLN